VVAEALDRGVAVITNVHLFMLGKRGGLLVGKGFRGAYAISASGAGGLRGPQR
jgi:hypothetical protein